jgi:hypothetical protein
MASHCRQEVLNVLQGDWAEYISRYRCLSPEGQSAFPTQQGYARLGDLLAHIVAWWKVGYQSVERYITDPDSQPAQYDVDAFNARSVEEAAGLDEAQLVDSFEQMRRFLFKFVKALPDTAFENEKVVSQLEMEFVGHFREHRIEVPDM